MKTEPQHTINTTQFNVATTSRKINVFNQSFEIGKFSEIFFNVFAVTGIIGLILNIVGLVIKNDQVAIIGLITMVTFPMIGLLILLIRCKEVPQNIR